jgi:hypothetical protein
MSTLIFLLTIPIIILYYIYYLEQKKCKCISSWYHNYIKYYLFAYILAILIYISIELCNKYNIFFDIFRLIKINKTLIFVVIITICIITSVVFIYTLFAYVYKLEETQCICAVHDMKYLHKLLYYTKYIIIAIGLLLLNAIIVVSINN